MCGKMYLSLSVFIVANLIALELIGVDAGNSNGRFKYIKRPVSKYKVKDDDSSTNTTNGENENGDSAPLIEEQPDGNGESAPQEGVEQPESPSAPREGVDQPESPRAPGEPNEEPGQQAMNDRSEPGDDNKLEGAAENPAADESIPTSPSEEGAGVGADNETPMKSDGNDDDSRKNNEFGGQNSEGATSEIPDGMPPSTSSYPTEGEGEDRTGTTRAEFLYTNELGEPVFHYSPPTRVISFRRTSTTIINGKRYQIQNKKRGWNRQTILSAGD